jgi:hypothetical protein
MTIQACRSPEHLEWIATSPIKPWRWGDVCWRHVARDIVTEIAQRRRVYPDRVAHGQMTPEEAEYQIAIFNALVADVARIMANACDTPPDHRYSRAARIDALLRERSYRQRLYPKWVTTGQITQDKADHRMACLDALLERFDEGLDWDSQTPSITDLAKIYAARWHGDQPQQQLAL